MSECVENNFDMICFRVKIFLNKKKVESWKVIEMACIKYNYFNVFLIWWFFVFI